MYGHAFVATGGRSRKLFLISSDGAQREWMSVPAHVLSADENQESNARIGTLQSRPIYLSTA